MYNTADSYGNLSSTSTKNQAIKPLMDTHFIFDGSDSGDANSNLKRCI